MPEWYVVPVKDRPTEGVESCSNMVNDGCQADGTNCRHCVFSDGRGFSSKLQELLASNIEPFKSLREGTYNEPN